MACGTWDNLKHCSSAPNI